MQVLLNNILDKYENEIFLKDKIIDILNQIYECKKLEIKYKYSPILLENKIRGLIKCDKREFSFKCNEFLEDFIIDLNIYKFTKEDEEYFKKNGCSENFLQLLKDRVNISNKEALNTFIKKIEEYEKNNLLNSFEEEIIVMIKREFYMESFLGSEDLDNNIRISEYQL